MIPQELGGGAKVTINFTPTGGSATEASFPLGGTKWAPGMRITYVLSTTKLLNLSMGTITYPDGWEEVNKNAERHFKSSYTNGDFIGMYVVDKNNKVKEANLKFKYNDGNWTNVSGKEFKGSPQYNYFVYYPYQEGGLPGAPAKDASNIDVTSAEKFFANAIANWKIATDQSTLKKMNDCDLQIGKASLDEDGCSVSFTMEHAMGLAEITLGAKTFDANYKLFDYESYTWKNRTTFHAYAGIKDYSFYQVADYRYVALVKPDVTTGFSCGNTTDADAWTENVLSVKPAANGVAKVTAISKRTPESYILYTMEVGDIYYSDGAMTHQSEDLAFGKTPIGIVGYLGKNYWTEKDTKENGIGGHALVMCLKTIGSAGKTSIGTKYAWYSPYSSNSSNIDAGRTKVTSKSLLVNSYNETYGSGYAETDTLIQKWDSVAAAAYQAQNYKTLPANSSKCTGWFLPTAGQYYAVMTSLGAPFSDDWTGIWDGNTSTHPKEAFFKNMTTVTKNINDKLKKVGDSNYTEFFGDLNTWAWTSSEFSYWYAVHIDSGVGDSKGPGSVRFSFYANKRTPIPVRPFLAF